MHELARKWLPPADVPNDIDLEINYSSFFTCNAAFRSPAIYLLPESASCVNAGEHPGIVQHEWGHALDSITGPGGDFGEPAPGHPEARETDDEVPYWLAMNEDAIAEIDRIFWETKKA